MCSDQCGLEGVSSETAEIEGHPRQSSLNGTNNSNSSSFRVIQCAWPAEESFENDARNKERDWFCM